MYVTYLHFCAIVWKIDIFSGKESESMLRFGAKQLHQNASVIKSKLSGTEYIVLSLISFMIDAVFLKVFTFYKYNCIRLLVSF